MSKTWKWILGITLGLVILVGVGFVAANFFGYGHMSFWGRPAYYGHPMMDDYGFGNRAPMDNFRNFRHPMMGGRGYYPLGGFFFLGGLLRLIFPLGVLALVAYFSYKAGKQAGMNEALAAAAPEPVIDAEPEEPPKKRGRRVA
jgi:hypothetical protein